MRLLALLVLLLLVSACAEAPSPDPAPAADTTAAMDEPVVDAAPGDTTALNAAVRAQIEADGMEPGGSPFRTAFVDLNGDGVAEGLAFMQGMYCGTGGCTLYVFEGGTDGFTLDSNVSLARDPIIVADSETNGWRDLVFEVSGGGAPAKVVALQHGTDGYPGNASMVDAATDETFEGEVVFPFSQGGDLSQLADFVGQNPADADLWNQPFLSSRLQMLLWGGLYEAFTERMQTVSPVQEENGLYYVTGNMDNAGGTDAAVLVADPEQNVLKAWVWQNGEPIERAEAPIALDLPSDVETLIQNMEN